MMTAQHLVRCLALGTALAGCRAAPLEPPAPTLPFLAIVTRVDGRADVFREQPLRYRVSGLSEGRVVDTTVTATPADTVILRVPPAEYLVVAEAIPPSCFSRQGASQSIALPEGTNTGVVRYTFICDAKLTVTITTEGRVPDPSYVWRLSGAAARVGTATATDTLVFSDIPAGDYVFDLADVAPNCVVTSLYGDSAPVEVPAVGLARLEVRVTCSDPASRPVVTFANARSVDGIATILVRAADPQRDIDVLVWEVTDCRGRALADSLRRTRRGLAAMRAVFGLEPAAIGGTFETPFTDAELRTRCAQVHVFDREGNASRLVEVPFEAPTDLAPVALRYNARIIDQRALVIDLVWDDAERDQLLVFPTLRLRDGVLGPPNGRPDIGIYSPAGYLDPSEIPELALGGTNRIQFFDVLAVDVYLFDRKGDVRRLRDDRVFE